MAKAPTAPNATPAAAPPAATPVAPAVTSTPATQSQDAALQSVGIILPGKRVYEVAIENCLLGVRFVVAGSEAEALEKYKRPCGITRHRGKATAKLTQLDSTKLPEGVTLYGE